MKNHHLAFLIAIALTVGALLNSALADPKYDLAAPPLANSALSPGDALPVTAADICVSGYAKKIRDVPESVKAKVYQEYGIAHHAKGEYEVDHLISLELGGSNSIHNLWPQSYKTTPWNAHVKDRLEDAFHKDVCTGKTKLADAQSAMSSNWIDAYKARFPTDPLAKLPTPKSPTADTAAPFRDVPTSNRDGTPADDGQVWVNTKSGVYWRPGTRYYGKTEEGEYMTEADAIAAHYRPAGGK